MVEKTVEKVAVEKIKKTEKIKDPWKILKHPYLTEKSMGLVETANTIVFVVDRSADNKQIKQAFEQAFDVEVEVVNTMITTGAEKKAFIKLGKKYKAADVAVKLGAV